MKRESIFAQLNAMSAFASAWKCAIRSTSRPASHGQRPASNVE